MRLYLPALLFSLCVVIALVDGKIGGSDTWHEALRREEAEDHKYPEHVRTKRQLSRQSFQQYLANMGRADYDVREEEGMASSDLPQTMAISFRLAEHSVSIRILGARRRAARAAGPRNTSKLRFRLSLLRIPLQLHLRVPIGVCVIRPATVVRAAVHFSEPGLANAARPFVHSSILCLVDVSVDRQREDQQHFLPQCPPAESELDGI